MILVTGATGTTGSIVLRTLAEKGAPARAMARNPDRVPAGFDAVRGDFGDATSLRSAVADVDAVFLLSSPGGHIASHDLALLAVAAEAGVRKIVKVSAIGTGEPGHEVSSAWHRPGEEAIKASGLGWTILRPSSFASNALSWAPQIQAGQPIPNHFGTGANGLVDPADVAAVAVEALLTDDHNEQIYTLTGPELLSLPDQVAQLAEVIDQPLRTVTGADEQLRADLLTSGADEDFVQAVLAGYEFIRQGGNAVLTDDVERALSRPPGTFKVWAERNRAAFAQPA